MFASREGYVLDIHISCKSTLFKYLILDSTLRVESDFFINLGPIGLAYVHTHTCTHAYVCVCVGGWGWCKDVETCLITSPK